MLFLAFYSGLFHYKKKQHTLLAILRKIRFCIKIQKSIADTQNRNPAEPQNGSRCVWWRMSSRSWEAVWTRRALCPLCPAPQCLSFLLHVNLKELPESSRPPSRMQPPTAIAVNCDSLGQWHSPRQVCCGRCSRWGAASRPPQGWGWGMGRQTLQACLHPGHWPTLLPLGGNICSLMLISIN